MSKSLKFFLCAAMIAALALMVFCGLHYRSLGKQLVSAQTAMDESMASWNQINAEKLILKDELDQKNSELREAELSLSELTEKAETLKKDIAALQQEIDSLKDSGD